MMFPSCTCCGTTVPCGTCSDSTQYQITNVTVDLGTTGAAAYGSTPCYNPTCNYCSNFTGLLSLNVGTGCSRATAYSSCGGPVDYFVDFAIATIGSNVVLTVDISVFKLNNPYEGATYSSSSSSRINCDTVTSFTLNRTVLTVDSSCQYCTTASYPASVTVYLS